MESHPAEHAARAAVPVAASIGAGAEIAVVEPTADGGCACRAGVPDRCPGTAEANHHGSECPAARPRRVASRGEEQIPGRNQSGKTAVDGQPEAGDQPARAAERHDRHAKAA